MYFDLGTDSEQVNPHEIENAIQRFMDFVPVPLALSVENETDPFDQFSRKITFVNKAFTEQIGYDLSHIPNLQDYFQKAFPDEKYRQSCMKSWQQAVADCLASSNTLAETIALVQCANEEQRWFAIAVETVSQIHSKWHMISFRDVHDIKRQLDMFDNLAKLDPLTDLLNRREMTRLMSIEASNAQRTEQPFSILLCDLDHFKQINDVHGHDAGDLVLKAVSKCFQNSLRASDYVARWGGEEFLIMLPNTSLKRAIMIANRLLKNIRLLDCEWSGQKISATTSIGLATIDHGLNVDQLIMQADQALYRAKNKGRNQLAIAEALTPPNL